MRGARRRRGGWALLLALGAALPPPSSSFGADPPPPGAPAPAAFERIFFLEAERAFRRGERERFRRLKEALGGYPLQPWLELIELRGDFWKRSERELESFLETFAGTPVADRARVLWLDRLASAGRWERYLEVYEALPADLLEKRHECHRALALLETGRDRAGFEAASGLWRFPRSQDDACDPVFALWAEKGGRGPADLWGRIEVALEHGNRGLAGRVALRLEPAARKAAVHWIGHYGRPARIVARADRIADEPAWRLPVESSIARLARRDSEAAAAAWRKASKGRSLPPGLDAFASWRIGLGLAQDHRIAEAADWLQRVPPGHRSERLLQVLALLRFVEGRWREGLASLDALPSETADELRWRYWRGRALDALGRASGPLWSELASERDYYGFLAADRIGRPYRFNHLPNDAFEEAAARLERTDGFLRTRELHAIGYRQLFEHEWRRLLENAEGRGVPMAAAVLAARHGWHRQGIEAAALAGEFDYLEVRFPLAWRGDVTAAARRHDLNPAWVFAIIRRESAFSEWARSGKDARGLMQLLPATARRTARATGLGYLGAGGLYRPEANIRLGAAYLRRLLDRLHDRPALAIAAYNAGPSRVDRWLELAPLPADLWVEMIPFVETREYVKRVLEYHAVYEYRLGRSPTRLRELLRAPSGELASSRRRTP